MIVRLLHLDFAWFSGLCLGQYNFQYPVFMLGRNFFFFLKFVRKRDDSTPALTTERIIRLIGRTRTHCKS